MNEAELYSKYHDVQGGDAGYVLENYSSLIKWSSSGKDKILDVGCGSGDVTSNTLIPFLPEDFEEVIGIDRSEEMVEFANKNYREKKLSFQQFDITSMAMPSSFFERFDHVVSFYCFHWIQDQKQAFSNIYRSLKPGGDMLIVCLAHHPIYELYKNMAVTMKWKKYMNDLGNIFCMNINSSTYTEKLKTMLGVIGFNINLCCIEDKQNVYKTSAVIRKSVSVINPFLKRIPFNQREDYLEDYMDEARRMGILETDENETEKMVLPYKILVLHAIKCDR